MAAEVTLVRGFYFDDRHWRRLGWILPAVCAAWLAALFGLGAFIERRPVPEEKPIDATLIEMPAEPTPPQQKKEEVPPPPPPRRIERAPAEPVVKQVEPEPAPIPQREAPAPPREQTPPPAPPPTPTPRATAPSPAPRAAARAIYRPLPTIPDELREQAMNMEALARFDVQADGTVSVELVKPTPYPALNRVILDTLRAWKFFPAMENGRPVASSQDVRITLEVR